MRDQRVVPGMFVTPKADAALADVYRRARASLVRGRPKTLDLGSAADSNADLEPFGLGEYVVCEGYGAGRIIAIDVDPEVAGGEPIYTVTFEVGWLHLRFAERDRERLGIARNAVDA